MIYVEESDKQIIANQNYNGEASIVILVNNEGKTLLILRDDIPQIIYPGYWTVPGGMKEPEETPEETAYRETFEETGFIATGLKPFAQTIDTAGRNELVTAFTGTIDKAISELTLGEGAEIGFFSVEEIKKMKIIPFVKTLLLFFLDESSSGNTASGVIKDL